MKNYILALIVLSIFVVSGVNGCPGSGDTEAAPQAAGLSFSFVNNAPPISAAVNQEFPIYVEVSNEGGDYINPGEAKFYLSGVGPNLEGVSSSQSNSRTLPKQSVTPDRISFADNAKFTEQISSLFTIPLVLTSCYSYGTTAQVNLCLSTKNESSVCTISGEKINQGSNSVAPVQITSFRQELVGNIMRISFVIENKMGGEAYLRDTNCDNLQSISESFKNDKVNVEVRINERERSGFICKLQSADAPYAPLDSLMGTTSLGTVVCEKTLSGNENFATPLGIVLRYKYVDSISKSLNIVP